MPHPPQDDLALMERLRSDDAGAFAELYDRFSRRAFSIALAVTSDRQRAEDVVQEAFLSAWRARDRFRPDRGTPSVWLLSIVRNQALDAARAHRRHDSRRSAAEYLEHHAAPNDGLDDRAGERDEAARLRATLGELPLEQREAIALAYFGELTTSEIAQELDLPLGTVKGRIRLGLGRLRALPVGGASVRPAGS